MTWWSWGLRLVEAWELLLLNSPCWGWYTLLFLFLIGAVFQRPAGVKELSPEHLLWQAVVGVILTDTSHSQGYIRQPWRLKVIQTSYHINMACSPSMRTLLRPGQINFLFNWTPGKWNRVSRLIKYLPVINNLSSDVKTLSSSFSKRLPGFAGTWARIIVNSNKAIAIQKKSQYTLTFISKNRVGQVRWTRN